jgi:hypothetical protein
MLEIVESAPPPALPTMLEIVESTPPPPPASPATAGMRHAERLIADKLANARRAVIKAGTARTNAAQAVEEARAGMITAPDDPASIQALREARLTLEECELRHEAREAAVETLEASIQQAQADGSIERLADALDALDQTAANARQDARVKRAAELGAELAKLIEEADADTAASSAARSKAAVLGAKLGLEIGGGQANADIPRYQVRRGFQAGIETSKLPSFMKGWFVGR